MEYIKQVEEIDWMQCFAKQLMSIPNKFINSVIQEHECNILFVYIHYFLIIASVDDY